jgi:hypothetical protein
LEWTDEEKLEHARIGKEYNRQTTLRDNQLNKDLTNKIWLQQEAIRALPAEYKEKALEIDESYPIDRPMPTFMTPPIPGFNPNKFMRQLDDET